MRDILPYLDESMLEHLATAMGLVSCRRRRQRSRHLLDNSTSFSQAQLDRFVGVTLDPMDAPNIFDTTCRSDPPSSSSSSTSSLEGASDAAVSCRPIQGGLTVFAKLEDDGQRRQRRLRALQNGGGGDDQDGIRRTVLQFLQEAMSDDIFVVPSSIEKVVFIDNDSTAGSSGGGGGGTNTNTDADASGVAATSGSAGGSQNSKLGTLEIGLIAGGGALLLLLILLCCCFCCRRRRRRNQRHPRDIHSNSTDNRGVASPVWSFHDEEDGQGILIGTAALAELDSLALQPQKGELLYVGDDKNSVSTSHSTAASSSNMYNKSSKAGTPLSSRDGTPNMDDDGDDDSLFEFEGFGPSFPAITRDPSDGAVSHIRSHEFVIASAQSQPPSAASLSTMVHANLGNRPPPSVASSETTSSFSTLLNSTMTTGSVPTSFTTAVLRDAAYSTTHNSYDEEIMGITEGGEEGQEASAAAYLSDDDGDDDSNYFKMARSTSDASARRDLQMT